MSDNLTKLINQLTEMWEAVVGTPAKPPMACSILTTEGNVCGAIVENPADSDNLEGESAIDAALKNLHHMTEILRKDFGIAMVAVTAQIDWDIYGLERRLLQEAGLKNVLYICPETLKVETLEL